MSTWLWYLFIAGTGLSILGCFRALVEEWVLHTHTGTGDAANRRVDVKHAVAEGVTMQQVRAQRSAYRRALAGGLDQVGAAQLPSTQAAPTQAKT